MREFVVEVPATVRVTVDADTPSDARLVAAKLVDGLTFGETLERVGGVWQLVQPEIIPPHPEDEPEVFMCSGGELVYVNDNGSVEPTGEDCLAA